MTESIPIESIRRIDVKPGETLLVRMPIDYMDPDEIDNATELLQGALPDGVKILITNTNVEFAVASVVAGDSE